MIALKITAERQLSPVLHKKDLSYPAQQRSRSIRDNISANKTIADLSEFRIKHLTMKSSRKYNLGKEA